MASVQSGSSRSRLDAASRARPIVPSDRKSAIAPCVVLLFLFVPSRLPAMVGTGLLVVFFLSSFLPPIASMPSRYWMTQDVADAARIYGSGGFAAVQGFRVQELPGFLPLHL